jgi:hypothetical protein
MKPMLEFPVNVTKSEDGDYIARLADRANGPQGNGVDPYAALNDLKAQAIADLALLDKDGRLPIPSKADDRPVIIYENQPNNAGGLETNIIRQGHMLGYCWTNDVVFSEK